MRRALELAARADYLTSPNPMVGAIVLDRVGELVGEGFHARAGEHHAEKVALDRAGASARGGTLYATLEPCSHHGRTPPCADAVIAAGIRRAVIAMEDPDPKVAGSGIARLRAAGVEVEVSSEAKVKADPEGDAARHLNRFYLKHRSTGLPWVTVKFGSSLDGRISTTAGESRWITGEAARQEGHRLRQRHDAILVGAGTIVADDPELTNRLLGAVRQPLRVVLDSTLRIPRAAKVLDQRQARTLVVTTERAPQTARATIGAAAEVATVTAAGPQQRVDLNRVLELLGARDIISVLVEGGAEVNGAFFDADLVDGVAAFLAPLVIGGRAAPAAVGGEGVIRLADAHRLTNLVVRRIGDDLLIEGDVHRDR